MIIPIGSGKHVKVVFKNGTVIEGIVKEWVSNYVELQSLNDESIMIIAQPEEDIMLIKVLPDKPAKNPEVNESAEKEQIRQKLKEVEEPPQTEEAAVLQQKNIAELRRMVVEQDKKMIQRKVRDHFPSGYTPHKPDYGNQIDMIPPGARKRGNNG